jgi:hypothetical protein
MRNLITFVGMLVLTVAVVGWYLGWYQVHTLTTAPGHRSVKIDIDTNKVGQDLKKGGQKLEELGDKYRQGAAKKKDNAVSGESEN